MCCYWNWQHYACSYQLSYLSNYLVSTLKCACTSTFLVPYLLGTDVSNSLPTLVCYLQYISALSVNKLPTNQRHYDRHILPLGQESLHCIDWGHHTIPLCMLRGVTPPARWAVSLSVQMNHWRGREIQWVNTHFVLESVPSFCYHGVQNTIPCMISHKTVLCPTVPKL